MAYVALSVRRRVVVVVVGVACYAGGLALLDGCGRVFANQNCCCLGDANLTASRAAADMTKTRQHCTPDDDRSQLIRRGMSANAASCRYVNNTVVVADERDTIRLARNQSADIAVVEADNRRQSLRR